MHYWHRKSNAVQYYQSDIERGRVSRERREYYTTSASDGKLEAEAEAEAQQEHTDSLGHGSAS